MCVCVSVGEMDGVDWVRAWGCGYDPVLALLAAGRQATAPGRGRQSMDPKPRAAAVKMDRKISAFPPPPRGRGTRRNGGANSIQRAKPSGPFHGALVVVAPLCGPNRSGRPTPPANPARQTPVWGGGGGVQGSIAAAHGVWVDWRMDGGLGQSAKPTNTIRLRLLAMRP